MRESMASRGCVIFVGNLPGDVREREVEDLFIKVALWLPLDSSHSFLFGIE